MNLTGVTGYAPLINIVIARDGRFLSGKIHSHIQHKGVGSRSDALNLAAKEIKALTEADIANPAITIDGEGNIRRK